MLLAQWKSALAAAALVAGFADVSVADPDLVTGQRGSSGGKQSGIRGEGAATAALESTPALFEPPLFVGRPTQGNGASESAEELVLVPLPAPIWVTVSGLTGLALMAAWRKHRLRSD